MTCGKGCLFDDASADLYGRLLVLTQQDDSVQGVVTIRAATPKDNVIGTLIAEVNFFNYQGGSFQEKCFGHFSDEEQVVSFICDKKVLRLSLNNSDENLMSYMAGSFASAEVTFVDLPLTEQSPRIAVEVKNLDRKR
ncbi:MAG: hypothetical protein HUU57_01215 [Bdellovibrio sp.]|nr:hypothetical protein [Bdellovibrio sp.]